MAPFDAGGGGCSDAAASAALQHIWQRFHVWMALHTAPTDLLGG